MWNYVESLTLGKQQSSETALGARLAARGGRTALGVLLGVDTVQVSDVTVPRARRDFEHTGRLRRSSRLSTLRAGGSA